jgi:outer membrane protein assembly factor BamB
VEDIAMTAPICIRFVLNLAFVPTLSLPLLAQPVVTVSPTSGEPTEKTTVSGTGFGASETVDIYFDTADLALAITDRSGSFSGIQLTVPGSAVPGKHTITGVGRNSGLSSQTNSLVRVNWAEFRRNHFHTGYNPREHVLNVGNVGSMQLLWSADIGDDYASSPAVANGVVYVGSRDGYLHAFHASNGHLIWRSVVPYGADSSPAVANGMVYVGGYDGNLYAFNATTGHLIWSAAMGWGAIYASPAVANGVVYVGSVNHSLYAFNASTGHLIWSVDTDSFVNSSLAVANGVVYAASYTAFCAFNASNGQLIWSATGSFSRSSPAVADGVVYVGSEDGKLYAFGLPPALAPKPPARPDPATLKPSFALVPPQP